MKHGAVTCGKDLTLKDTSRWQGPSNRQPWRLGPKDCIQEGTLTGSPTKQQQLREFQAHLPGYSVRLTYLCPLNSYSDFLLGFPIWGSPVESLFCWASRISGLSVGFWNSLASQLKVEALNGASPQQQRVAQEATPRKKTMERCPVYRASMLVFQGFASGRSGTRIPLASTTRELRLLKFRDQESHESQHCYAPGRYIMKHSICSANYKGLSVVP